MNTKKVNVNIKALVSYIVTLAEKPQRQLLYHLRICSLPDRMCVLLDSVYYWHALCTAVKQ